MATTRTKPSAEVAAHAILAHFQACGPSDMPELRECPCGGSQVLVCPNCEEVLAFGREENPCQHSRKLAAELGIDP